MEKVSVKLQRYYLKFVIIKEDIDFDELYSDVLQIIDDMRRFGFVTFVEEGS